MKNKKENNNQLKMFSEETINNTIQQVLDTSKLVGYTNEEKFYYELMIHFFKLPRNKFERMATINYYVVPFKERDVFKMYFLKWNEIFGKNLVNFNDIQKENNVENTKNNTKNNNTSRRKKNDIKKEFVFELEDDYKKESNSKTRNKKFQNNFKKNVLKTMEEKCAITGVCERIEFCHIKPYSNKDSNNYERQDGFNGIILYSGIHKLFDEGLISFENDGTLLISNKLNEIEMQIWKSVLVEGKKYEIGNETGEKTKYLEYHRNNIFRGDK